jgi:phosphatidate cytidylyltransferase
MAKTPDPSAGKAADDGALWKRAASAVVLVPLTIGALNAGGAAFSALVAFLGIVMTFEWSRMIENGRDFSQTFAALGLGGGAAFVAAAAGQYAAAFGICAIAGAAAAERARFGARRSLWAAFGAAYIIAPSIALIWLRNETENGAPLVLMLFLIVWAADTGGYIAGRLVGGPKLSPAISPAKTWAGAVGGLVLGGLAGMAAAHWVWGEGEILRYAVIGGSLGLASILGDMTESAFKRVFGVKDSSGFIPGHGGALDRLDGMIFATTAMALVLYFHILFGGG